MSALLAATHARAADVANSVYEAYARRGLVHESFDVRNFDTLPSEQARFLERFFALTDEAVVLNTNAALWFASEAASGVHPDVFLPQMDALLIELARVEPPTRLAAVHDYVAQSLRLQRSFWSEWHAANEAGLPFASQLTDEVAYHEGLHRSRRLLLKAYAELRAVLPDASEVQRACFRSHLHAMSPG